MTSLFVSRLDHVLYATKSKLLYLNVGSKGIAIDVQVVLVCCNNSGNQFMNGEISNQAANIYMK